MPTGLHGANRLASNSLLEAVVFAERIAAFVKAHPLEETELSIPEWNIGSAISSDEQVVLSHNWDEIRRLMWNYVGIVRTDNRLRRALSRVDAIREELNSYYWNYARIRKTINDETNKVESFHNFADWLSFGDNVIRENHTDRQEKMTKYKHLLANAVILQNAVDLTNVLSELRREGVNISQKTIEGMSPYFTKKVRRFGYFDVDFPQKTEPFPEVEKLENILIN